MTFFFNDEDILEQSGNTVTEFSEYAKLNSVMDSLLPQWFQETRSDSQQGYHPITSDLDFAQYPNEHQQQQISLLNYDGTPHDATDSRRNHASRTSDIPPFNPLDNQKTNMVQQLTPRNAAQETDCKETDHEYEHESSDSEQSSVSNNSFKPTMEEEKQYENYLFDQEEVQQVVKSPNRSRKRNREFAPDDERGIHKASRLNPRDAGNFVGEGEISSTQSSIQNRFGRSTNDDSGSSANPHHRKRIRIGYSDIETRSGARKRLSATRINMRMDTNRKIPKKKNKYRKMNVIIPEDLPRVAMTLKGTSTRVEFSTLEMDEKQDGFLCTCDLVFATKEALTAHVKIAHDCPVQHEQLVCKECKQKFRNQPNLTRHASTVHGEDATVICNFDDTCRARFKTKRGLANHQKSVHNKKYHQNRKKYTEGAEEEGKKDDIQFTSCQMCEYASSWKGNVQRHQRLVHFAERSFHCQRCGHKCGTKHNLDNHNISCGKKHTRSLHGNNIDSIVVSSIEGTVQNIR